MMPIKREEDTINIIKKKKTNETVVTAVTASNDCITQGIPEGFFSSTVEWTALNDNIENKTKKKSKKKNKKITHGDESAEDGNSSVDSTGSAGSKSAASDSKAASSSGSGSKDNRNKNKKGVTKQRRSWKKPKDKPKRPLSAYNIFFKHTRSRIVEGLSEEGTAEETIQSIEGIVANSTATRRHRKTHGQISFGDLARRIADKWKDIGKNSTQKALFDHYASLDMTRYRREVSIWKAKKEQEALLATKAAGSANVNASGNCSGGTPSTVGVGGGAFESLSGSSSHSLERAISGSSSHTHSSGSSACFSDFSESIGRQLGNSISSSIHTNNTNDKRNTMQNYHQRHHRNHHDSLSASFHSVDSEFSLEPVSIADMHQIQQQQQMTAAAVQQQQQQQQQQQWQPPTMDGRCVPSFIESSENNIMNTIKRLQQNTNTMDLSSNSGMNHHNHPNNNNNVNNNSNSNNNNMDASCNSNGTGNQHPQQQQQQQQWQPPTMNGRCVPPFIGSSENNIINTIMRLQQSTNTMDSSSSSGMNHQNHPNNINNVNNNNNNSNNSMDDTGDGNGTATGNGNGNSNKKLQDIWVKNRQLEDSIHRLKRELSATNFLGNSNHNHNSNSNNGGQQQQQQQGQGQGQGSINPDIPSSSNIPTTATTTTDNFVNSSFGPSIDRMQQLHRRRQFMQNNNNPLSADFISASNNGLVATTSNNNNNNNNNNNSTDLELDDAIGFESLKNPVGFLSEEDNPTTPMLTSTMNDSMNMSCELSPVPFNEVFSRADANLKRKALIRNLSDLDLLGG